MNSVKFANQRYIIWLHLITSKLFPMKATAKNLSFWICLIFGKLPRGTEWHSLVLQSAGSVELSSSKKIHAYTTFRLCKKYLFGPWTKNIILKVTTTANQKETWTSLNLSFRSGTYFIETIVDKGSLIFAFTVFLSDSLHCKASRCKSYNEWIPDKEYCHV